MDTAEFDRVFEGMEWEEVRHMLLDVVADLSTDTVHTTPISPPTPPPNPTPPPPPPPPPAPAGQGLYAYFQPVESHIGGYSEHAPLVAPFSFEQPGPLIFAPGLNVNQHAPIIYQGQPLYYHNIMHSQGQYLPYQFPGHDTPVAACVCCPEAPAHQNNNVPMVMLQENQSLHPVNMMNREPVYLVEDSGVTPPDFSKNRERENRQDDDRPYVKKPPNAFMLYMKEQRHNVAAELKLKGCAVVNTFLGQKWKSLSWEEQAKYFDQANKERRRHEQQHPGWAKRERGSIAQLPSRLKYLPYQFPGHDTPVAACVCCPEAPAHQNNNVPVVMLQENQSLHPVDMMNRECENRQDDDRPYVKKPPNAFMLYMKEQRHNVAAELKLKGCAVVNTFLGQKWKSLSWEEQAKYFDQANKERRRHEQQHPGWSANNNYGKKRKRQYSTAPIKTEASAFNPEYVTHQAKKPCVTPVQTVEIQPSPLQTHLIEDSHTQTVQVQLPNSDCLTPITESTLLASDATENHLPSSS
ncbi:hypothetical protein PAMA_006956 [Pampus argenteus]